MTIFATIGLGVSAACAAIQLQAYPSMSDAIEVDGIGIELPEPVRMSDTSVEQALLERRSVRHYRDQGLTTAELSQLLWAAQGVTHPDGLRTAPSAGALYPLEVYAVVGNVDGLTRGVYRYNPPDHRLVRTIVGDRRSALSQAALGQGAVEDAAAVIVLSAIYGRSTLKYGEQGIRYAHIEVGAAAQNIYLQATSLDLGTVFIGAFHDQQVKDVLILGEDEAPLGLMPVGRP